MLELKPTRFLSTDYAVTLQGVPLTVVTDTQGPLAGHFTLGGQRFRIGLHTEDVRGAWGVVRAVVRGVAGRGTYVLRAADDGSTLALARRRGLRDGGFDLELAGTAAVLEPLPDGRAFRWRGAQGEGAVRRLEGRGLTAVLPVALAPALQVFVALLALSRWETVSTGSD